MVAHTLKHPLQQLPMTAESIDLQWLTAMHDSLVAQTCRLVHAVLD